MIRDFGYAVDDGPITDGPKFQAIWHAPYFIGSTDIASASS